MRGVTPLLTRQLSYATTRYAVVWKRRPSGWKRTSASVSEGATAVMLTFSLSAPRGITNQLRRTSSTPPSGPIVWVTDSYASGRQERRESSFSPPPEVSAVSALSLPSSPPGCRAGLDASRLGVRGSTPTADGSLQLVAAAVAPSNRPRGSTKPRRDMRFSGSQGTRKPRLGRSQEQEAFRRAAWA